MQSCAVYLTGSHFDTYGIILFYAEEQRHIFASFRSGRRGLGGGGEAGYALLNTSKCPPYSGSANHKTFLLQR